MKIGLFFIENKCFSALHRLLTTFLDTKGNLYLSRKAWFFLGIRLCRNLSEKVQPEGYIQHALLHFQKHKAQGWLT